MFFIMIIIMKVFLALFKLLALKMRDEIEINYNLKSKNATKSQGDKV